MNIAESKMTHKTANQEIDCYKPTEESEILTSRFEKSSGSKKLLHKEEPLLKPYMSSLRDERHYNKSVLIKVKNKLRKLK